MADENLTPTEMRRRLQEIASRGYDIDHQANNRPEFASATVSNVLRAGRYGGWSGEDTYTVLAWSLYTQVQRLGRIVYDGEMLRPPAAIVVQTSMRPLLERVKQALEDINTNSDRVAISPALIAEVTKALENPLCL